MRWLGTLLMICLLAVGCGLSVAELEPVAVEKPVLIKMTRRFVTLRQVQVGMSRTEVRAVLALPIIVGYELYDRAGQQYKPLTEKNPQRSESLNRNSKEYEIDYYLVGIQLQDGQISDDEIAPLIFRGDKLIGIGWDYLKRLGQ